MVSVTNNLFDHTFKIQLEYVSCPECLWIQEDRNEYKITLKGLGKDIKCSRCGHSWYLYKNKRGGKIKFLPNAQESD